ncbi:MAG: BatD family protein [Bacteroidota bacterium]
MIRRLFFVTTFITGLVSFATAQISFRTVTDAKKVTVNGYFEVQFVLENGRGEGFRAPDFQGLQVMGGPNQSMSTTIRNGVVASESSYGYVLQPTRVGKVTIGRASVVVKGKTYRTEPITIEVVESKSRPKNKDGLTREDVFLKAEVESETIYIGQQVPLNYRIYTIKNVNSYNILDESAYQGFYAEDLRRFNAGVIREVIDGTDYVTKVLKKLALFPQQTGTLEISPMQMQVGIAKSTARNSRDFFFTPDVYRVNISSPALQLDVKPLPANPPESFTGGVGFYTFTSSIEKRRITTDDALEIRVVIAGNGDVKRVEAPNIDLGAAFDVYEPKLIDEQTREVDGEMRSRRVYEYLALPKVAGVYEFQLEFAYFNTTISDYDIIQSEPYTITVAQGSNAPVDRNPIPDLEKDDDIHYIKSVTNLESKSTPFFGSTAFWGLTGMPFLLFLGVIAFKQVKKQQENIDPLLLKNKLAQKLANKHLSDALLHLKAGKSRAFYDEVSKAMLGYVNDKLNIRNSELTKENVVSRLEEMKVPSAQIERFMQVIKTCEMALFARKDTESDMQATYDQAIDVLVKIEESLGRKK